MPKITVLVVFGLPLQGLYCYLTAEPEAAVLGHKMYQRVLKLMCVVDNAWGMGVSRRELPTKDWFRVDDIVVNLGGQRIWEYLWGEGGCAGGSF
jgi:hypothetical protein